MATPDDNSISQINNHDLYELQLLEQIEHSPLLSNRKAASILGVSLKLAHDVLGQMVHKGLVSVTKHHARRWDYFLTPAGITAKARLSYEFLHFSMHFFRQARRDSAMLCRRLMESGKKRVAIVGSGNLAEIVYLGMQEWDLELVAVYDDRDGEFMRRPIQPLAQVAADDSDAIIICSYDPRQPMSPRFLPPGVQENPRMYWPVDTAMVVETVVVVDAGMGMSEPSGLILAELGDSTVLDWGLERLRDANLKVVVSTSTLASDDAVATRCLELGVPCFRGDVLNRAQRLLELTQEHRALAAVRVNGLCPLLDPDLVKTAVKLRRQVDCPVIYCGEDSAWPLGLRLEVYDISQFQEDYPRFERPEDFAEVLPWYQRHKADELHTLTSGQAGGAPDVDLLASDEAALAALRRVLAGRTPGDSDWRQVTRDLAEERP